MRRSTRALAAMLLLVLGAPAAAPARHGGVLLDARRATPGIQLELVELPRTSSADSVRYRLRASGVPHAVTLGIWTKDFGAQFQRVRAGFRADERGVATTADGQPAALDQVVLEPGPYLPGAAWEVSLASDDGAVSAFARVFPRPLTARSGSCAVALELISRRGDRFMASATGFAPGEEVSIEVHDAAGTAHRRLRVGADGAVPSDEVFHRPAPTDHRARYEVRGRACEAAISYEWGPAALVRR
jgi:hypothetical protein